MRTIEENTEATAEEFTIAADVHLQDIELIMGEVSQTDNPAEKREVLADYIRRGQVARELEILINKYDR